MAAANEDSNPGKTRPEKSRPGKTRIDLLLVARGLAASRERARALILAGRVLVREQKIDKPGAAVPRRFRCSPAGRGPALRQPRRTEAGRRRWSTGKFEVAGRACLDVGASTGGFTDCLLQHGAAQVTAVDTGFGQIAMKLRNDPRVRLLERTNARLLEPGSLSSRTRARKTRLLVMDVSFISATLRAPAGSGRRARAGRGRRPGQAAVRGRPRACGQGRHRARSRPRTSWRSSRVAAVRALAGLAGRGDHSIAHHRRRGQPGVPALREAVRAELRKRSAASRPPIHYTETHDSRCHRLQAATGKSSKRLLPELIAWLRQHGYDPVLDREGGSYTADCAGRGSRGAALAEARRWSSFWAATARCWPPRASLPPSARPSSA